jgi:hypothetical protein
LRELLSSDDARPRVGRPGGYRARQRVVVVARHRNNDLRIDERQDRTYRRIRHVRFGRDDDDVEVRADQPRGRMNGAPEKRPPLTSAVVVYERDDVGPPKRERFPQSARPIAGSDDDNLGHEPFQPLM